MSSKALLRPMYSCMVPPKSLVILYLPSEKAPAPPKPDMIAQVLHLTQDFTLSPSIGHLRFSRALPVSNTATFKSGRLVANSYAEKMPPGPAPMMMISYFMFLILLIVCICE